MENKIDIYIRCKRCNRLLKSEEARQRGYGEHCWQIHLKDEHFKNTLFTVDKFYKRGK